MTHKAFYKNALWQYGLQVVKYLFPLITLPYLARVLDPQGYAVYAYVVSFMSFAQIFVDFGFDLSGTPKIINATSIKEENKVIGAITEARLILCAIGGLIVFLIASLMPITREYLLYTMLSYVAVCGRALCPNFIFQGKENMRPITSRYFASKGTSTLLTFVFVHSMADILWIPILDILASAIALIWSFAAAKKMFGTSISAASPKEAFSELKTSALYCFSNMSAVALSGFTTLFIGFIITDRSQVSYWSISMTAISAVQSLYNPITNSLYPHMINQKDFSFARKIALIALPLVAIGTAVFACLSSFIMYVLGGGEYVSGSSVLAMVSPVLFFSFFGMLFGWPVLGAQGKVAQITASTITSAAICIGLLAVAASFDMASMQVICVIRCVSEAVLCAMRLGFCMRYGLLLPGKPEGSKQ